MTDQRTVAILLFEDVEVLDFAGPYEVFSVTRLPDEHQTQPFNVVTVAEHEGPVLARNGLSINPDHTLETCPPTDILVVPGGRGTRAIQDREVITGWVADRAAQAALTLSVCTGSLVLGKAGLLDGLRATTHHSAFDELREAAPAATVDEKARFVDNGTVITSAGISAGIDMALYTVAKLLGGGIAWETARYMEYDWNPDKHLTTAPPPAEADKKSG